MRSGLTRAALGSLAIAWLAAVAVVRGQGAADRPLLAEDVFKNVQVLRGVPVNDFMGTMGIFSAALGMSCEDCHRAGDSSWANYAAESPRKQMARSMVVMMTTINKTHFGGRQAVTCFSCHRGTDRPKVTPSVAALYDSPPPEDPRDIIEQARTSPAAEEVLGRYVEAVGGAARAATITSLTATGTSTGYGPDSEKRPLQVVARAPNQRTMVVRTSDGASTTTFDGRRGWLAAPFRPVPVLELTGGDLDGLRLDAELAFPSRIREVASRWRVGLASSIGDRDVQVVQGTGAGGATVTLYFDAESGLLVRQVRYVESPVGRLPTQIDYADYRDVSGVKVPFRWTMTWLDGRDTIELTDVRANAPVDPSAFLRPGAPTPGPRR
jgi:outer membrane lipoprotein-sorting protein